LGRLGFVLGLLFTGLFSIGFFLARLFLFRLLFLFHQFFPFFFAGIAFGDVALAVEINAAIDQGFLDDGVGAERVVIVNDEVGILADVDGTNALVDAELDRGILGFELERFVVREAAVPHGFGSFLI
jgi:hypothetical protein